jgi:hypothetical protein
MGYDFESDKAYNVENTVSMTVETQKTCYFPGEFVTGNIILRPKEGISNPLLSNPYANLILTETFHYTYCEDVYNPHKGKKEFTTMTAEESMTLLQMPLNFTNFLNANIMQTVVIPFQVQLPMQIYPSVIFSSDAYVKHHLSIDFPSIQAKKTVIIVIKNNQHFTTFNQLWQQPAVCFKETTKHALFVSKGSFKSTLTLPRNAFTYDEKIPFTVDIDCSQLSLNIKGIKVTINRNQKKNHKHNHSTARSENKTEIATKKIPLNKGQKVYHVEDCIQLSPDYNPQSIYDKLDRDTRKYSEKYNGVRLNPTCYGGLIGCEYYIKMVLEMDSLLSSNEDFRIPIDLYASQQRPPYPQQTYPPQQPYPQQPYPQQPYPQQPYPQQIPPQQIPPQQPQYPNQPPSQYPNQPPQYPNQPPQYPNQPPQYPPQQIPASIPASTQGQVNGNNNGYYPNF